MSGRTPLRNVHTGDWLRSKEPTDQYRTGWDRIFGKKPPQEETPKPPDPDTDKKAD